MLEYWSSGHCLIHYDVLLLYLSYKNYKVTLMNESNKFHSEGIIRSGCEDMHYILGT